MKKAYILVIMGLVLSCSGSGGDDGTEDSVEENKAPSTPVLVYPQNNTTCIENIIKFEWNASTDSENNPISYKLEISENSNFVPLTYNSSLTTTSETVTLAKGKAFYWRVKALDSKNAQSNYTTNTQFLIEGDAVINHAPFAPILVAPELNSEINGDSTVLSWTAFDTDGDALVFDVYLDKVNPPSVKVSENQSASTFNANNLSVGTDYFFKVVVKDDYGNSAIGQVWNFKTK
jgi:hypothetical protein